MPMTTHDLFWQLPEQSKIKMASTGAELPLVKQPGISRSSSDSVVISNKKPAINVRGNERGRAGTENEDIQCEDTAVQTTAQGTLVVAIRASPPARSPPRAKARHQLQLPSFQALGIAVPYPASILTPPEEPAVMDWKPPDTDESEATPTANQSVPSHVRPTSTPQSLFPGSSILGASNDTPTQGPIGSLASPSVPSAEDHGSESSNSSAATEIASNAPWLEGALTVIREYTVNF